MDAEEHSGIGQRAAVSKKVMAWKLFPYTDGRFAFYPGSGWNKGFVLTAEQAKQLMERLDKKGISFVQLLVIGVIAGGVWGQAANIGEGFAEFVKSGWFLLFLLACVPIANFVEPHFKTKKLKAQFGDLPECEHPFPSDYFRLRTLTVGFFRISVMVVIVPFSSALIAMFAYMMIEDEFSPFDDGVIATGFVFILAADAACIWFLYLQVRFRRLNGRRPQASDLQPVDPQTGRMAKHPFREPL